MSIGLSPSDFVNIPHFAWKVYQACQDNKGEYQALANEVTSLHNVLLQVSKKTSERRLNPQNANQHADLVSGCHGLLLNLSRTLTKYDILGEKESSRSILKRVRRGGKQLQWALDTPGEIRTQLLVHISMLTLFNTTVADGVSDVVLEAFAPPAFSSKVHFHVVVGLSGISLATSFPVPFFLPQVFKACYDHHAPVSEEATGFFDDPTMSIRLPADGYIGSVERYMNDNLLKAMGEFQYSFPDRHGFRTSLIELALEFSTNVQVRGSVANNTATEYSRLTRYFLNSLLP
ncbi:hypothetical protein DL98DRAFT_592903 [Cadophora sp. DSE1049]|nr:hypothetical protein DL98DRAFT_592903 [Cadophora sp. DSE1049]